jgi:hypothetical protein
VLNLLPNQAQLEGPAPIALPTGVIASDQNLKINTGQADANKAVGTFLQCVGEGGFAQWRAFPGSQLGVTAVFGGSVANANNFLRFNGNYLTITVSTVNAQGNNFVIPANMSLRAVTYDTASGTTSTRFDIYKNLISVQSFNLTNSVGYLPTANLDLIPNDVVSVRFISGTAPGNTTMTLYFV